MPKPLLGRIRYAARKGVASLAIAALAFASSAASLIDGIDGAAGAAHFETQGGPATESPFHNHSLCAMVGATPVLPGAAPPTAVSSGSTSSSSLPQIHRAPSGVRVTTCRSRAPPIL